LLLRARRGSKCQEHEAQEKNCKLIIVFIHCSVVCGMTITSVKCFYFCPALGGRSHGNAKKHRPTQLGQRVGAGSHEDAVGQPFSLYVNGQTQDEPWHGNVVNEASLVHRTIVDVEVSIASQQNEPAVKLVS
jgi:hypothetical protein